MLRRDFLKYTSAAAAMVLIPVESMAATYTGPLWIFVQASGGWDPTSFCDPKGFLPTEVDGNMRPTNNAMNKSYAAETIATSTSAPDIKYAPVNGNGYDFSKFFNDYGAELLIVNGIDTQTNGHDAGRRYIMSGRLAEGYPALSALIAGVTNPTSPLAFVTSGGYDETGGVVAGTRLGNTTTIEELAFSNRRSPANADDIYKSEATMTLLEKAQADRIQREIDKQNLEGLKQKMGEYQAAHSGSNELKKLIDNIKDSLSNNRVYSQGRLAMAGYKAGLTSSVNISLGGFDTHGNHDTNQLRSLGRLLEGVDLLKQEAKDQGIAKKVIFVMMSDFGRTPGYNVNNGKDHWSVSSVMFMGPGIRGGRVVGSSSARHNAEKVNPKTLKKDINGIKITYAHVNKAMRKLAGIEANKLLTQYYPLDGTIEDLDLFS